MVSLSLTSKLVVEGFPVWSSKPTAQIYDLSLKVTVSVSWFGPQNQADYGLLVAPQNRWEYKDGMRHASRSGLLQVEACRARVYTSGLKTGGSVAQMMHMARSWRFHREQIEGGWVDVTDCIRPCCPYFIIFTILGFRAF
jgi:hypothetical protein